MPPRRVYIGRYTGLYASQGVYRVVYPGWVGGHIHRVVYPGWVGREACWVCTVLPWWVGREACWVCIAPTMVVGREACWVLYVHHGG